MDEAEAHVEVEIVDEAEAHVEVEVVDKAEAHVEVQYSLDRMNVLVEQTVQRLYKPGTTGTSLGVLISLCQTRHVSKHVL